jgi:hypothetical protein
VETSDGEDRVYAPAADDSDRLPWDVRHQAHLMITRQYERTRPALPAGMSRPHESPFADLNITSPGPVVDG